MIQGSRWGTREPASCPVLRSPPHPRKTSPELEKRADFSFRSREGESWVGPGTRGRGGVSPRVQRLHP